MNLKELATKPVLTKLTIEDEETITTYGEQLDFYVYDKQPIDVFLQLSQAQSVADQNKIADIMSELILDKNGKRVINKGHALPPKVLAKALILITDLLSK